MVCYHVCLYMHYLASRRGELHVLLPCSLHGKSVCMYVRTPETIIKLINLLRLKAQSSKTEFLPSWRHYENLQAELHGVHAQLPVSTRTQCKWLVVRERASGRRKTESNIEMWIRIEIHIELPCDLHHAHLHGVLPCVCLYMHVVLHAPLTLVHRRGRLLLNLVTNGDHMY